MEFSPPADLEAEKQLHSLFLEHERLLSSLRVENNEQRKAAERQLELVLESSPFSFINISLLYIIKTARLDSHVANRLQTALLLKRILLQQITRFALSNEENTKLKELLLQCLHEEQKKQIVIQIAECIAAELKRGFPHGVWKDFFSLLMGILFPSSSITHTHPYQEHNAAVILHLCIASLLEPEQRTALMGMSSDLFKMIAEKWRAEMQQCSASLAAVPAACVAVGSLCLKILAELLLLELLPWSDAAVLSFMHSVLSFLQSVFSKNSIHSI
jgi:hypothetical protein